MRNEQYPTRPIAHLSQSSNHLRDGFSSGHHRKHVLLPLHGEVQYDRPVRGDGLLNRLPDLFGIGDPNAPGPVSLGQFDEVRSDFDIGR